MPSSPFSTAPFAAASPSASPSAAFLSKMANSPFPSPSLSSCSAIHVLTRAGTSAHSIVTTVRSCKCLSQPPHPPGYSLPPKNPLNPSSQSPSPFGYGAVSSWRVYSRASNTLVAEQTGDHPAMASSEKGYFQRKVAGLSGVGEGFMPIAVAVDAREARRSALGLMVGVGRWDG